MSSRESWCIFSDPHYRPDNLDTLDLSIRWVINEVHTKQINRVFILGDIFNSCRTYNPEVNTLFCEHIRAVLNLPHHPHVYVLIGNHDLKDLAQTNHHSMVMLNVYKNETQQRLHIVDEWIVFPDINVVMVPYYHDQGIIARHIADFHEPNYMLMGHLNIRGVKQNSGSICKDSHLTFQHFSWFDYTVSGHEHKHQLYPHNVEFVGSIQQHSFGEAGDHDKGYIHYVPDTKTSTFVCNPHASHYIVCTFEELSTMHDQQQVLRVADEWKNKYVRFILREPKDYSAIVALQTWVRTHCPSIKLIEPHDLSARIIPLSQHHEKMMTDEKEEQDEDGTEATATAVVPKNTDSDWACIQQDMASYQEFLSTKIPETKSLLNDSIQTVTTFLHQPHIKALFTKPSQPEFPGQFKTLVIQNFKSVFGTEIISFEQNQIGHGLWTIEGLNGHGKTTLFDAIQWCLFGDLSPRVKDKFILQHSCINQEAAKRDLLTQVTLCFTNGVSIRRSTKEVGLTVPWKLQGKEKVIKKKQDANEEITTLLNTTRKEFINTVIINPSFKDSFFQMDEASQKQFFEEMLGTKWIDPLKQELEAEIKRLKAEEKKQTDTLQSLTTKFHKQWDAQTAEYNRDYDLSQHMKQTIKQTQERIESIQSQLSMFTSQLVVSQSSGGDGDVGDDHPTLTNLHEKEKLFMAEQEALHTQYTSQLQEQNQYNTKRNEVKARHDQARAPLVTLHSSQNHDLYEQKLVETSLKKQIEMCEQTMHTVSSQLAHLQNTHRDNSLVEQVHFFLTVDWPHIVTEYQCPEQITRRLDRIAALIQAERKDKEDQMQQAQERFTSCQKELSDLDADLNLTVATIATIKQKIQSVQKELDAIHAAEQSELPPPPPPPPSTLSLPQYKKHNEYLQTELKRIQSAMETTRRNENVSDKISMLTRVEQELQEQLHHDTQVYETVTARTRLHFVTLQSIKDIYEVEENTIKTQLSAVKTQLLHLLFWFDQLDPKKDNVMIMLQPILKEHVSRYMSDMAVPSFRKFKTERYIAIFNAQLSLSLKQMNPDHYIEYVLTSNIRLMEKQLHDKNQQEKKTIGPDQKRSCFLTLPSSGELRQLELAIFFTLYRLSMYKRGFLTDTLFIDECTEGLDNGIQKRLINNLCAMLQQYEPLKRILYITHNLDSTFDEQIDGKLRVEKRHVTLPSASPPSTTIINKNKKRKMTQPIVADPTACLIKGLSSKYDCIIRSK